MSYIPIIPIKDLIEVTFKDTEYKVTRRMLNRICKDGNINKNKHLILFSTDSGILRVNATVWMVGKKYILLKGNLYIPIKSIIEIE